MAMKAYIHGAHCYRSLANYGIATESPRFLAMDCALTADLAYSFSVGLYRRHCLSPWNGSS